MYYAYLQKKICVFILTIKIKPRDYKWYVSLSSVFECSTITKKNFTSIELEKYRKKPL